MIRKPHIQSLTSAFSYALHQKHYLLLFANKLLQIRPFHCKIPRTLASCVSMHKFRLQNHYICWRCPVWETKGRIRPSAWHGSVLRLRSRTHVHSHQTLHVLVVSANQRTASYLMLCVCVLVHLIGQAVLLALSWVIWTCCVCVYVLPGD